MNDSDNTFPDTADRLRDLRRAAAGSLAAEGDLRAVVLNAVDGGLSLEAVARESGLPLSTIEQWTGLSRDPRAPAARDERDHVDEVGEQRLLRHGNLQQRRAAADQKQQRRAAGRDEARDDA